MHWDIRYTEETGSTNEDVTAWGRAGEKAGAVLYAARFPEEAFFTETGNIAAAAVSAYTANAAAAAVSAYTANAAAAAVSAYTTN